MRFTSARLNAAAVLTAVVALTAGLLAATPAQGSTAVAGASPAQTAALAAAEPGQGPRPAPLNYTPPRGVLFNNPLGTLAARRRIIHHLIRTIDSVPGREKIRIASWNIRSDAIADALIRAHKRGVSVRLAMDRLNASDQNPNPVVRRLNQAFKKGDENRRKSMTSDLRRCVSSCRNKGGIAHSKFFLFTKAGKATDVIINGSNNATDLATHAQWNDVYTVTGRPGLYRVFDEVFAQMRLDKNVTDPYVKHQVGNLTTTFYPYKGKGATGDPLLAELNRMQCAGATGGTGTNGRTKIRIAQTSMHGDRGKRIAERLAQMYTRGCDIKIVYAVFGNEVLRVLRNTPRGAVPLRQIAQDHNLDGVYDRYLHMKNMAVSGVYGGRTDANVTWNGSANWTSVAMASDEVLMRVFGPQLQARYADWVDYLYANPPRYTGARAQQARQARLTALAQGIDPYAKMQLD